MGSEGGAELIVFMAIVQCLHGLRHLFFFGVTVHLSLTKICVVYYASVVEKINIIFFCQPK